MTNMNTTTRLNKFQKAREGIGKHFQNVSSLTLGGTTVSPTDLMNLIQVDLDKTTELAKARAALKVLVQAERDAHAQVLPLLRLLKAYVIGVFGATDAASSTLEDFGYSPR